MFKIKIKILLFASCLLVLGVNTFAQKNMNEDFRKSAPAPLAPKPFEIAKPFETTLPNGLKIVVFEDKRLPIVSYRLAFRTGDANDPKDSTGLTSAVTSQLSRKKSA
jgi:zinc protease